MTPVTSWLKYCWPVFGNHDPTLCKLRIEGKKKQIGKYPFLFYFFSKRLFQKPLQQVHIALPHWKEDQGVEYLCFPMFTGNAGRFVNDVKVPSPQCSTRNQVTQQEVPTIVYLLYNTHTSHEL